MANWRDTIAALLGVSAYEYRRVASEPPADTVEKLRESLGGNLAPIPITQVRWYMSDIESAQRAADSGDLSIAARLYRAMRRDGMFAGLLSTCTDGLVRLPKRFYGDPNQVSELEPRNGSRSLFEEMFPPSELALLAADGRILGVGVGELVPVSGRDYPVLVRLDPEWLRYRWNEGRWYYHSIAGPLPITPGDGRWVLHCPGGRSAPWQSGLIWSNGRAWINKEHALLHRSNYSAKLANPARVAVAPQGASEEQTQSWCQAVMAWGINTVFASKPGYDVKLLESNGRGFEVFQQEIASSDLEFMVSLAGQVVTTTGGTGFANANVHQSIRADIIKAIADGLAYTINTQGIPPWVASRWGVENLESRAVVEWNVEPPKDQKMAADSLSAAASAIIALQDALSRYGRDVDIVTLCNQFGIPVLGDVDGDGTPDVEGATAENSESESRGNVVDIGTIEKAIDVAKSAGLRPTSDSIVAIAQEYGLRLEPIPAAQNTARIDLAPADLAKVIRVNEARTSQGLPPLGDDRGDLMIDELANASASTEQSIGVDQTPEAA